MPYSKLEKKEVNKRLNHRIRNLIYIGIIASLLLFIPNNVVCNEPQQDPLDGDPYHTFVIPDGGFGINETVTIFNHSYFWRWVRENFVWRYDIQHPISGEWIDYTSDYLTIHRNRSVDNSSEKIALEFFVPEDDSHCRFTLACELEVLEYIDKSGDHEYTLTYPIPGHSGLNYSVFFNWSDVYSIPGIIIKKGIKTVEGKEYFYFLMRKQGVGSGTYIIDPTFGHTTGSNPSSNLENYQRGYYGTIGNQGGYCTYIKAHIQKTGVFNFKVKAALYTYAGINNAGDLIAETGEETVTSSTWYQFDFNDPPWVNATQTYYVAVIGESDGGVSTLSLSLDTNQAYSSIYTGQTYPTFLDPWTGERVETGRYCIYGFYTVPPTQSSPSPGNESTCADVIPELSITVDDDDDETIYVIWRSNATDDGEWTDFAYEKVDSPYGSITEYNTNMSSLDTSYWWSVNLTDGYNWENKSYSFTTTDVGSSVDVIDPYDIFGEELYVSVTDSGSCTVDDIDLYYRYSSDNSSWNATNETIFFDDFDTGSQGQDLSSWGNWSDGSGDFKWRYGAYTSSSYTGCGISSQQYPYGGSGKSLYTEASARYDKDYFLESDSFTVNTGDNISVEWQYHMYGSGMGELIVQVNSGKGWVTLWSISGQQHTGYSDPWSPASLSFDSNNFSGSVQIRFYGRTGNTYRSDICIDHIFINRSTRGWMHFGNDDSSPFEFLFPFDNDSGYYEFISLANDGDTSEWFPGWENADARCNFTFARIYYGQLDGAGGGRGETGGDPLYDEVPLNNSFQHLQSDGFWTSISTDYTRHYKEYSWGNFTEPDDSGSTDFNWAAAQSFMINDTDSSSFWITNISIYCAGSYLDVGNDFDLYIVNMTEDDFPINNFNTDYLYHDTLNSEDLPFLVYDWYEYNLTESVEIDTLVNYSIVLDSSASFDPIWRANFTDPEWFHAFYYSHEEQNPDGHWTKYDTLYYALRISGYNGSNVVLMNLTFDWFNDTSGEWEEYGNITIVQNQTTSVFNSNFSGVGLYKWRVNASVNESGSWVNHSEWYQFNTFVLTNINKPYPNAVVWCSLGLFGFPFLLFWRRRRKESKVDG